VCSSKPPAAPFSDNAHLKSTSTLAGEFDRARPRESTSRIRRYLFGETHGISSPEATCHVLRQIAAAMTSCTIMLGHRLSTNGQFLHFKNLLAPDRYVPCDFKGGTSAITTCVGRAAVHRHCPGPPLQVHCDPLQGIIRYGNCIRYAERAQPAIVDRSGQPFVPIMRTPSTPKRDSSRPSTPTTSLQPESLLSVNP
jgi:hypothetical protein